MPFPSANPPPVLGDALAPPPIDESALLDFARWLQSTGYEFTTITPSSHATVNARPGTEQAHSLRDAFGWSRPFRASLLPRPALDALRRSGLLREHSIKAGSDTSTSTTALSSRVRFSTLDGLLLAHSAFPTDRADAVFFGPDTYRFARLVAAQLALAQGMGGADRPLRVLDVGCGSGAGGLCAARRLAGRSVDLWLADINPQALPFARVNAALAQQAANVVQSDCFAATPATYDLVIANPPYLYEDEGSRLYRDGKGELGTGLAVRIVREGLPRLAPGGRLILYSGAPVVAGTDVLRAALAPLLEGGRRIWDYQEIDPDVFGEELDRAGYATVDRIAAVGLVVRQVG